MEKPSFDELAQPLPSRGLGWRSLGLGLLLVTVFAGGFLLARLVPDWPKGKTEETYTLVRFEPLPSGTSVEYLVNRFLHTQVELVRSPVVLLNTLATPKVRDLDSIKRQSDPEAWLRKSVRVTILPGTFLLRISMNAMSRREREIVVNEITRSYIAICNNSEPQFAARSESGTPEVTQLTPAKTYRR